MLRLALTQRGEPNITELVVQLANSALEPADSTANSAVDPLKNLPVDTGVILTLTARF